MPRRRCQRKLQLYQQITVGYPKPTRNYDALVLTATKRLSAQFLVLRVVYYSRSVGNYPACFSRRTSDRSQYLDPVRLAKLLIGNGPVAEGAAHTIKARSRTGSRYWDRSDRSTAKQAG